MRFAVRTPVATGTCGVLYLYCRGNRRERVVVEEREAAAEGQQLTVVVVELFQQQQNLENEAGGCEELAVGCSWVACHLIHD